MSERNEVHEAEPVEAVAVRAPAMLTTAVPVDALIARTEVIQDAMRRAMRQDEHYGIIPGTGKKPSLLKPGAEKLCVLFNLHPHYNIAYTDLGNGHRDYQVSCELLTADGQAVGEGSGSCSTMESKYRWRQAERICPECGKPAIIKGKAEYGGGWLCFKKKDGCGAKYRDGDPAIESQEVGRVDNPELADIWNTVLKMAQKRALVAAVLTTTACSDVFTQDLEDMGPGEAPAPPFAAGPPVRGAPGAETTQSTPDSLTGPRKPPTPSSSTRTVTSADPSAWEPPPDQPPGTPEWNGTVAEYEAAAKSLFLAINSKEVYDQTLASLSLKSAREARSNRQRLLVIAALTKTANALRHDRQRKEWAPLTSQAEALGVLAGVEALCEAMGTTIDLAYELSADSFGKLTSQIEEQLQKVEQAIGEAAPPATA